MILKYITSYRRFVIANVCSCEQTIGICFLNSLANTFSTINSALGSRKSTDTENAVKMSKAETDSQKEAHRHEEEKPCLKDSSHIRFAVGVMGRRTLGSGFCCFDTITPHRFFFKPAKYFFQRFRLFF